MSIVYLGLGANLGDREVALAEAVERIDAVDGVRVIRVAPAFETAPIGLVEQPRFLNSAVEIETQLTPGDLLCHLKEIEADMGRTATVRWGPRLIDIDVLLYGDQRLESANLTVPHPEMWHRAFVLAPLAQLRTDLLAPDGRTIIEVLGSLMADQDVRPHDTPVVTIRS